MKLLHYYIGAIVLLLAGDARAAFGQTAALLMAEPMSVRPMGMAGALVSQADDESSIQANPAGLSKVRGLSLGGGQLLGLLGLQASQLTLVSSLSPGTSLGLEAAYLYDSDTYRDVYGNESGSFNNSNLLVILALGSSIHAGWRIGGSVKGLQESYAANNSLSLAADLGLQGPLFRQLRFGILAQNLGTQLNTQSGPTHSLPLRIQGGLSLPVFIPTWRLNLELQSSPTEAQLRGLFGTELAFDIGEPASRNSEAPMKAALRAGFISGLAFGEPSKGSLGAGLTLPPTYALDYALVNTGSIGATHRVSLTLRFPGAKPPAPPGASLSAPYNLKITEEIDGIVLNWEDSNDRVEGYNLYSDYGVLIDRINEKPVKRRYQKFKGVDRKRLYHFHLKPLGSDGKEGQASEVLEYRAK